MKSVVIFSMVDLYYGNSAAVVRMNNYARALALANVDVYLLSALILDAKKEWIEVEPHIYTLPKGNAKSGKGYNPIYVTGLILKIMKLMGTIRGNVVFFNYPSTSSLLLDIMLLLFCKRFPIFCEVNEVRRYASGSNNSIRNRAFWYVLEKTYKYYQGVVFISRTIQEYYTSKVRKSLVVPILSDCDNVFVPTKGIDTLDFVFVGTVSFSKENLEELLKGFCLFVKEHPEARLKLYGILSSSDKKILDSFIEKNDIKEQILYLGKLQHSEVEKVLSTAGALLLSRSNNKQNYYGFSTKLSEYAVSGAPIIMTNTGIVADYFQDRVNCLMCDGYDRYAFDIKFKELARMSVDEKQQMAKKAYLVAKSKFDYKLYSKPLKCFLFFEFEHEKTI